MMIFRNDCVIVEMSDIRKGGKVPRYVADELKHYYEPEEMFEVFKNEESIEYFRNREDIIDYDYISKLTDEEIKSQIFEIKTEVERKYQIYLDSPKTVRAKFDKDKEYNQKMDYMIYRMMKMEDYLRLRSEYDRTFSIFDEEPAIETNEDIKKLVFTIEEQ